MCLFGPIYSICISVSVCVYVCDCICVYLCQYLRVSVSLCPHLCVCVYLCLCDIYFSEPKARIDVKIDLSLLSCDISSWLTALFLV